MKTRPRLLLPVLLVLLLAGLFHSVWRDAPAGPSPSCGTLRIGIGLQPTNALALIAMKKRYFAAEGLTATCKAYPSGKLALHGLLEEEVDVATGVAEVPITFTAFQRQDFRVLAMTASADSVQRIVARRDAGIEHPDDLRGKRIATQRGSAVHFFLHQFLLRHAMTEDDVVLSFMKAIELPKALAEGRIDAFSMREPFVTQAQELLGEKVVIFTQPGCYFSTEQVVARADSTHTRHKQFVCLLKAIARAEALAASAPAEAQGLVADALKVPEEELQDLWPSLGLHLQLSQGLLNCLETEAAWAIAKGLVPEGSTAPNDFSIIHTDALRAVRPEAVTLIQ